MSYISAFFGIVTAAKAAGAKPQPRPTAALRMMPMGNDMCFWGPNGMISKFLASARTAVTELRALVARQAAAILRLLSQLANLGSSGAAPMGIAADAPRGAPPALNFPSLPAAAAKPPPRAEPPPAPAARATMQRIVISVCGLLDGKQPIYSEIRMGLRILTAGDEARRIFLGPAVK